MVEELPVPGLLGKPSLTAMGARLDLVRNVAELCAGSEKAELHAIALTAEAFASKRPQAQSYWAWLSKRMANAPKRLQTVFEDVMARADNAGEVFGRLSRLVGAAATGVGERRRVGASRAVQGRAEATRIGDDGTRGVPDIGVGK